jgi:hypothetical protein
MSAIPISTATILSGNYQATSTLCLGKLWRRRELAILRLCAQYIDHSRPDVY